MMVTSAAYHLVKALNLPNYHIFHVPNCYAHITIDGGQPVSTTVVKGSNPDWSECFDM
jgi:hypothetical protein